MADSHEARLAGRTALITCGASGIGRQAVELFAREGAAVVVADLDEAGGAETVAAVRAEGGRAEFVATDVSRAADVEAAVAFAERRFGSLHVLFNNAGIFPADDASPVETLESLADRGVIRFEN